MLTGHCQKLGNFVTDAVSGAANYADGVAARKSLFVMAIFAFGVASGAAFERLVPLAIRSAFPIPAYSVLESHTRRCSCSMIGGGLDGLGGWCERMERRWSRRARSTIWRPSASRAARVASEARFTLRVVVESL